MFSNYSGVQWDQIDFYVIDKKIDPSYLTGVTYSDDWVAGYRKRHDEIVDSLVKDANGSAIVDKGTPSGTSLYIDRGEKVLWIWKQAYVEVNSRPDSAYLIQQRLHTDPDAVACV